MAKVAPFMLYVCILTSIFTFFLFYSPLVFKFHRQPSSLIDPACDLSEGHWVPDLRGPLYTNSSCYTLPDSKNCLKHGRTDTGYLYWRWKPNGCELPRFNAKLFFGLLRGKTLGFIGDSVARNHMDSLLCLLSQEEAPMRIYKDSDDRFGTWHFKEHEFTLKVLWTKYLVASEEIIVNGSSVGYSLLMDKMEQAWSAHLPSLDYAVVSTGHWFNRPLFLHQNGTTKCVYCDKAEVSSIGVAEALGLALRAALGHITREGRGKRGLVTVVRTFSPAHFEEGEWNTGGKCARTQPYGEEDIARGREGEWGMREAQMAEVRRSKVEALDVTKAMLMRPDAHPGLNWDNRWMKGYSDCVHWCLPGAVDVWNDILLALISRLSSSSSSSSYS